MTRVNLPPGAGTFGQGGIAATPLLPLLLVGSAVAATSNNVWGTRVIIPKTGTLHDISIYVTATAAENINAGVYDTDDASAGNRSLLWSSGSQAVGASAGWRVIGDPALAVKQGQQLDFAFVTSATTATFQKISLTAAAVASLPTNYLPASGGAPPVLSWTFNVGSFTLPATITDANCAPNVTVFPLIGRIA